MRLTALLALLFAGTVAAADAPRYNVLLIISDDLCTRMGCYGDPVVKTPNVDKLAARGVRFEHAYCQYPLCNPSRASFLTGLRPDTIKVYDNGVYFRDGNPTVQTLGQTFQKAGYFVARVGKLYHYGVPAQIGTNGLDDPPSWNERYNPKGRDIDDCNIIEMLAMENGKAVWKHGNNLNQYGATLSWLAADGTDEEQTDGKNAAAAIELLEKHKDKPFFIGVGFFRPHTPYVAPKKYFDMYPPETLKLPTVPEGYRMTVPKPAFTFKPAEEAMSDLQRKEAIQGYHAATTFMDAQVGKVVDALDRLGLASTTVIVFMSDHGYHLYEHQLWQKQTLFECGAHVPMIVVMPGGPAGKICARTVELVDLHPTLADLAGVPAPEKLDGMSLRTLVMTPEAAWDKPALTQVQRGKQLMGYSMRTEKFRYTEWQNGNKGVELYDESNDPRELHNLAEAAEQKETVKTLSAQLHKLTGR